MDAHPIASPDTARPSLAGNCGYTIAGDPVVVAVGEIANGRETPNLSGTLGLELWALRHPYLGGGFSGVPLAGAQVGVLGGQSRLNDCRYDLVFQEPPTGTWYLTLMLREWEGEGFVTRDHVDFPVPYVVDTKPEILDGAHDEVEERPGAPGPAEAAEPPQALADSFEPTAKPAANPGVSLNGSPLKRDRGTQRGLAQAGRGPGGGKAMRLLP